ncbi:MAG: SCO family protein [Gammaproteobacteria bacterium]|nr:SCO family protein [Gammaproteobacteria bacterium]
MRLFFAFIFLLVLLFFQATVNANTQLESESVTQKEPGSNAGFDYDVALKISQDVIGKKLGGYSFTNAEGKTILMSDFAGKPLVLSMVYTSCYQICPMTTRHLAKVVEKARDALGKDNFSVAVIGFDTPVDTPDAMQYFANKQGIHNKDWHLLSVAKEDVKALSKDLGFIYFPSASGFDHLIQATIIDADGKVYQQVYGQVFDTPLLIEPLKELILGRPKQNQTFLSELTNKIKLFCTTYDPVRDGYYFDYSLFLGILIGATIILFTGISMVREWRKSGHSSDT